MADIAKALKEELASFVGREDGPEFYRGGLEYVKYGSESRQMGGYITGSVGTDPLGSGTYSFLGLDAYIHSEDIPIEKRAEVYLICRGCGKKFLFQRENITAPLFDMSCTCGTMLEFEKEKE